MYVYIYLTTNLINNKKYIGKHKSHTFDLETRTKRAESNRGQKHPGAGLNISKSLIGRKLSEEHKKKLSTAKLCKPSNNRKQVMCVETNEVFSSLYEATIKSGFNSSGNLCSCLKGNKNTAFGYHWKYVD